MKRGCEYDEVSTNSPGITRAGQRARESKNEGQKKSAEAEVHRRLDLISSDNQGFSLIEYLSSVLNKNLRARVWGPNYHERKIKMESSTA